jgi:uncharacterized protein (TIGR03437 family)
VQPTSSILLLSMITAAFAPGASPRRELLSKLPLRFERESRGDALFRARGNNFELSLAPSRHTIEWRDPSSGRVARVITELRGANPRASLEAEDRLPGSANYFLGAPAGWRTDITGYSRVRHRGVLPGIDLVFHGENGRLEYDFVLAPHADPSLIRMSLTGQDSVRVDPSGDLLVSSSAGVIRWKRPEIFQRAGETRRNISGKFVTDGRGNVSFRIGGYDHDRELVIDPTLAYSTFFGSTKNEVARGIALDGAGNIYIAGVTSSADLPTKSAFQPNFGGLTASPFAAGDGFVAKFNPSGVLQYLTYIGGSQDDGVGAIAVDAAGNAYIAGATNSSDFPTVNPFQAQFGGLGGYGTYIRTGDAFVAKINPAGNKLLYSTYLGGRMDDIAFGIAIDSTGAAYVTGATLSQDFPLSQGAPQSRMKGYGGEPTARPCCNGPVWDPGDAFITKLDPTGSKVVFSTYLGGSLDEVAYTIALDPSNNVYVGGCTLSNDFPTTSGAFQRIWGGTDQQNYFQNTGDGFVTKLNAAGTAFVYSTYVGGAGDDCVSAMAVDSLGNAYITGATSTNGLGTTPGVFQRNYAGYFVLPFVVEQLWGDAFVGKLNPAGSAFVYLTYLGGSLNDAGTAIAIDSSGDAYVAGWTDSPDFPMAGAPYQSKMQGESGRYGYRIFGDAFVALLNSTGTALLYSTYLGGKSDEGAGGIAIDGMGNVFVTGGTLSTNFPVTSTAIRPTYGGGATDAFLAIFSGFPANPPVITVVANAEGESPTIAANTWVEIKGSGFGSTTRTWQTADFVNQLLPTALDNVSVTMNGAPAFVYYISPTQINVLTPPDLAAGPVQVQVNVGGVASAVFTVQAQKYSPSFFINGAGPYILATHLDGSLIGPTTLYPGLSTPAASGETVIFYANGFGPTTVPVVKGALMQSGTLPNLPTVQIGPFVATVTFAGLISPGLYQFNVVIPPSAPSGDNTILSGYGGAPAPTVKITVR